MEQGTYQVIEQMLKIQPLDQKKNIVLKATGTSTKSNAVSHYTFL